MVRFTILAVSAALLCGCAANGESSKTRKVTVGPPGKSQTLEAPARQQTNEKPKTVGPPGRTTPITPAPNK
jgi:hypothetical protein